MTHSFFEEPTPRFSPKARRYYPADNTAILNTIGDYCFKCTVPTEECKGHE